MEMWHAELIDDEPHLELREWSVCEIRDGEKEARHLVGSEPNSDGHVSPALVAFDPTTGRFRACDGTIYEVVGEHGSALRADYALGRWLRRAGNPTTLDVTVLVVAELVRGGSVGR